jgi:hypothetical protein
MDSERDDAPPRIDASLDPIRAAIRMVAEGTARRVTVHAPEPHLVLPAARQLARTAGVRVEVVGDAGEETDFVLERAMGRNA